MIKKKHINVKYHLIQYHVEVKIIQLKHYPIDEKIINIFTKVLGREKFDKFRKMLGITNIPSY